VESNYPHLNQNGSEEKQRFEKQSQKTRHVIGGSSIRPCGQKRFGLIVVIAVPAVPITVVVPVPVSVRAIIVVVVAIVVRIVAVVHRIRIAIRRPDCYVKVTAGFRFLGYESYEPKRQQNWEKIFFHEINRSSFDGAKAVPIRFC
jgi:hypothetical protein